MNKKQELIERLDNASDSNAGTPVGVLWNLCVEAADLLSSGEFVEGLPELPEGCDHWERRPNGMGDFRTGKNGTVYCDATIIAVKLAPHDEEWLNTAEPGVFMWEEGIYWLTTSAIGEPRVCTKNNNYAIRVGGRWRDVKKCFGTSDISDLCDATVTRPSGWK